MSSRRLDHDTPGRPETARPEVEIRRSTRRRRTVQARMEGDTFVVLMPAGLSEAQEQRHVEHLLGRVQRAQSRRRLQQEDLHGRALELSRRYLDGRAEPTSIRWVSNQRQRWGSCSPATGAIRLSSTMEGMPTWVVDSVIVHELAHLIEPNHGPRFRALVHRYERYAEASAFLKGVAFGLGRPELDPESDADLRE